ncbi:MAG TPA: hypothetical protein DIC34_14525 [Treponema sp.]|nr:MAG: hypothetical protein A2001_10420 [Treponema sp. GWC1_61_84]OHE65619.1 MAG: hypothetical protein A2Y36_06820 [Treponema sp. GWA1_62_8]OHE72674.1 MAG: hypothetical protein A2413_12285 [Treponema sp. RIFOXYC1_FULL_61_9]HCM27736.1 hypothetical protein [Treponema sp.]
MNAYLSQNYSSNLALFAIFACICVGFAFLRNVDKEESAISIWLISFALNGIGFLFWSNVIPLLLWQLYIIGEVFHILGFAALVYGAYSFFGNKWNKRVILVLISGLVFWLFSIAMLKADLQSGIFLLRLFRSIIFISAAIMIFTQKQNAKLVGKNLAASGMLLWGSYILFTAIWKIVKSSELQFGILAGFHVLAAFGMVAMVVDRIRIRAEASEEKVSKLEGLLPICSYCKKIRDDKKQWQILELYIEEHSKAEFSHGICPDCMKKHHPEFKNEAIGSDSGKPETI